MNNNTHLDNDNSRSLNNKKVITKAKDQSNYKDKCNPVSKSTRQIKPLRISEDKAADDDNNDISHLTRIKSNDIFPISSMFRNEFDEIRLDSNTHLTHNSNLNQSQSPYNIQQDKQEDDKLCDLNKQNYNQINGKQRNNYYAIKTPNDASFLDRMTLDLNRRRTKDERMNILIEKSKVKHSEKERIIGFNRLIDDANRRIEAKGKMDNLKTQITEEGQITAEFKKSYNNGKWSEIYKERFEKFQLQSQEKILTMQKELHKKKQEDEEKVLEVIKETSKKISKEKVDQICLRLYEDQRKIFIKEQKDKPVNQNTVSNNNNNDNTHNESVHNKTNHSKEIRSITPNKIITKQSPQTNNKTNCLKKPIPIKTEKDSNGSHNKQDNVYKNVPFRIRTEYNHYTTSIVKPVKQFTKASIAIVSSPQNSNQIDIEFIEKNLISSLTQSNIVQMPNKQSNQAYTNEIKQRKMNKLTKNGLPHQSKSPIQSKLIMRDIDVDKLVQNVLKKNINY